MPKKRKIEPAEQSKLFIQTARELGADREAVGDDVMRRLVAQKRHEPAEKSDKPKIKKPVK